MVWKAPPPVALSMLLMCSLGILLESYLNDGKICHFTILFTFLCLVYLHTNTVQLCPSLIHCHFTAFRVQTHFFVTELHAIDLTTLLLHGEL
jgi:hypothetical protein